jgi:arylsulfatase A-like enzyme
MIWRPAPSAGIAPATVDQPVGHVDIARTICAAAGVAPDPRMQGAPLPASEDGTRERVITEWDGGYDGESVTLRTIYRDGYVLTACEPGSVHQGDEGELYDLANDPRQFENLWDDPARAGLKRDLLADLYDNLPAARTPPLEQVALV